MHTSFDKQIEIFIDIFKIIIGNSYHLMQYSKHFKIKYILNWYLP